MTEHNKKRAVVIMFCALAWIIFGSYSRYATGAPAEDLSYNSLESAETTSITLQNPYHYILSFLYTFGGLATTACAHVLLTLLTVVLSYFIGRRIGLDYVNSALLAGIFALSPLRMAQSIVWTETSIATPLFLLGLLLLLNESKKVRFAGYMSLALNSFFGIGPILATIITVIAIGYWRKSTTRAVALTAFLCVFPAVAAYYGALDAAGLSWTRLGDFTNVFSENITDLGGQYGFGLFEIIIGAIAAIIFWKSSKSSSFIVTAVFAIAFFLPSSIPFAGIFLAECARRVIEHLQKRTWSSELIKTTTITVIFCGLLFSSISFVVASSRAFPEKASLADAEQLKGIIPIGSQMLVLPAFYASFISVSTGAASYADSRILPSRLAEIKQDILDKICASRNLNTTSTILASNKIQYIVLFDGYQDSCKGLSFVLETKSVFRSVFMGQKILAWKYEQ